MIMVYWLAAASLALAQELVSLDESKWLRSALLPGAISSDAASEGLDEEKREDFETRYSEWRRATTPDRDPLPLPAARSKLWDIGQRFKRHVQARMFGEIQFHGVDLEVPETIDRLDSFAQNEFNLFMERRAARASEWYLSNVLDSEAEEIRDLLPDSWTRRNWFEVTGLRFGRTQRVSNAEVQTGAPIATADGSTLDQSIDPKWYLPFVDATSSFDFSELGEFRFAGRMRLKHLGGGIGWRPWPETFPVQFRFDFNLNHENGSERWETSANLDLFRLIDNGEHAGKRQLLVVVRYDSETEDGWAGIMFSH